MIGVYKIIHIESGRFYVGISSQLETRLAIHQNDLSKNRHHNQPLQNAYNRYGKEAFSFEVIRECTLDEAIAEEQRYLAEEWDNTYNVSRESHLGRNPYAGWEPERLEAHSKAVSEERQAWYASLSDEERKVWIETNSTSKKTWWDSLSEEERKQQYEKRYLNRKPISLETRKKMSESHTGKTLSQETIDKRTASFKETKRLQREAKLREEGAK